MTTVDRMKSQDEDIELYYCILFDSPSKVFALE